MQRRSLVTCVLAIVTLATALTIQFANAQDGGQDAAASSAQQGSGNAAQEFDELFAQWRAKLDGLRKLQVEYKQATLENQDALEHQFEELMAEAQEMSVRLQVLIEAAYVANPNDADKGDFLASMAYVQYKDDDFEESLRLCNMLLDGGYKNQGIVLDLKGQCEYLLGDFAAAEKNLAEAQTQLEKISRPLSADAQAMRSNLEADRKAWQQELAFQEADVTAEGDPMALPRVELETTTGKVVIELFENEAPNTVANFISLVKDGFYDGTSFHRVIGGFMAQGGDPNGDGSGGPGYSIPFESQEEPYRKHFRGAVAMAHGPASKDSGGSQFYIVFRRDQSRHLDGEHTVFGRVIEGMENVVNFARPAPDSENPKIEVPDRILSAKVLNARDHEYKFRKVGDPPPTTGGDGAATDGDAGDAGNADAGKGDATGTGGDAGTGGGI